MECVKDIYGKKVEEESREPLPPLDDF